MPTTPLLAKLQRNYPDFSFVASNRFSWAPHLSTIYYNGNDVSFDHLILHELSHGLLGHQGYHHDIELVAMERQAWDKATELAQQYHLPLDEEVIQAHLDTYREWMHDRSTCPACEANGYQTGARDYQCPACLHRWRVNEARLCRVYRHSLTTQK